MATYSDAYLNHFSDRYVALRLRAHGVSLEQYLARPALYEPLALEPEPLLPAQRLVSRRIAADWEQAAELNELAAAIEAQAPADARLSGQALREPLRHHTLPESHAARRRFYRGVA